MLRTAFLILSGNATASLLLLARNLIVARLIPVEDYGIAATFAVVMAMVEMASAFGLQQQIVQSEDGDDPRFQAALQGFQVLRGVAAGIALFLIAGPIARFLGIPEVIWAYQLLALVPVIKAFEHFDIHRLNRQMRFWPLMLTGGVPALLSLMLAWPLTIWLSDWRVMLYSILAQIAVTALTSHLVAERPYRIVFDRAIMGRSLRFGWPILVNSVLLFLVFQGDKLIVGRVLGMEALAVFAMGMMLTLTPTMVLAKSAQNFFLPQLSRRAAEPGEASVFVALSHAALQASLLNGAFIILAANLIGPYLINSLFAGKYNDLIPLVSLFALLNGIRVFKSGPAQVALARGHTSNAMISNLPRVIALPFAWGILEAGGTLVHILWLGIIAEFVGYFISLALISKRVHIPLFPLWHAAAAVTGFLVLSTGAFGYLWSGSSIESLEHYIFFLAFIVLLATMRNLHRIFLETRNCFGPSL